MKNNLQEYNDASEHYHEVEYGQGGVARAKEVIMNKIGYNEETADYFVGKSEKFAIWLADSILKEEIKNKNYNKKQWLDSNYSSWRTINANYGGGIREILDWLQHPVTPKQELKQLSFEQALEKAREWHNELQVLGGDIDFTEPEKNTILKKYPKNDEGIEYYWVFIPSNYCDLESSRMGHCGRTGYGNNLISLRSVKPYGKGHTISDSHVTIAYGVTDGIFYQVKGKKNNKPAEKYFPFIYDLIKNSINDSINIDFNAFGSEYGDSEDYGFEDMSNEELREIYDLKPSLFNDVESIYVLFDNGVIDLDELTKITEKEPELFSSYGNQMKLYDLGVISEKPSTTFELNYSCDEVYRLLDVKGFSDDIVEKILCGDFEDLTDSWSYYYENPSDLVDNLNKENTDRVIDEIVRITGYEKSVVEENGIEYYLNGEDENFPTDDFDNIIRVLASAQNNADQSDYYDYLYKQLESSLEELGEVHSLNDEGVKMTIDLSKYMHDEEIAEAMDRYEFTDIADLFYEEIHNSYGGAIDRPSFNIDDRYSPYGSSEDFNSYVSDTDLEQGYEKGGSLRTKTLNKKTKIKNMKPSQRKLASGGDVNSTGISKEDYFLVVHNWVYFTFNYPMGFVKDAFHSKHLEEKFSSSYTRYGSVSVLMSFWMQLDYINRGILSVWIKNNYFSSSNHKSKLLNISDDDYTKIINHWNLFCWNYPMGFIKSIFGSNSEHYENKFIRSYESAGSVGAVNRFFTELSSDNQRLFTDWVYVNYKGISLYAGGGRITTNDGIIESFLTSERELKVGNLSTHYNEYDKEILLRNYGTLIAKRKGKNVEITNTKYSKTTTIITNKVKNMALNNRMNVKYVDKFADGGLVVKNDTDLQEVAKYMTNAVKKHRWDLKDLIHYFEQENNFDYKKRVKIWEEMNGYEMPKTYNNIYEMLKRISEANGSKFADGGETSEWKIGDKFRVLKGIYGDYNSPRYANKEFEVINIRDGKYIDARTPKGTTETFDMKNIEKIKFADGGEAGKWVNYDKNHLINTETGMIVSKGTNLKDIKPKDIKGFEKLGMGRYADGGKTSGKWIIEDWAGNHLFKDKVFDSFEDGWSFIYENVKEESEDDGTYDDYYVIQIPFEGFSYKKDFYADGGEIEFKRGKGRGVVKEVYFKGDFRPKFYVSYDNNENDIKKGLKSWCKIHNLNYDDIIKVKYADGGEADLDYSDIFNVLKSKIDDAIDDIPNKYESASQFTGEEIEHESRSGFIPYTDGGYQAVWFETLGSLYSSGYNLPTKPLTDEMNRQIDYNLELARESFISDYPEIVEELGEENIDYNSLVDAGYGDEAEELSNAEMDMMWDDTILMRILANYYNPENSRAKDGKHTIRLFGDVNLESPYHRVGNLDDSHEYEFTFNSIAELESEMNKGLKQVISWFEGEMYNDSTAEMKVRRMEEGGEAGEYSEEVEQILENLEPEAVKFEGNSREGFSVLVKDKNSDFSAWVDVYMQGSDVTWEWNQYIFARNNSDDMLKSELQDNIDIADYFSSEAINYLEQQGAIKQDENGDWSYTNKYAGGGGVDKVVWKKEYEEYEDDVDEKGMEYYEAEYRNLTLSIFPVNILFNENTTYDVYVQENSFTKVKKENISNLELAKEIAVELANKYISEKYDDGGEADEDEDEDEDEYAGGGEVYKLILGNEVTEYDNLDELIDDYEDKYTTSEKKKIEIVYGSDLIKPKGKTKIKYAGGGEVYKLILGNEVTEYDNLDELIDDYEDKYTTSEKKKIEIVYGSDLIKPKGKTKIKYAEGGEVEDDLYVVEYRKGEWSVKDKKNPNAFYTLSSKKQNAENVRQELIDNPSKLKYYRSNEYAGGGEVEDWMEEALESLIEETGFDDLEITHISNDKIVGVDNEGYIAEFNDKSYEFIASNGNAEYRVFQTEGDAEETAIEQVREDLEESPENFNQDWLMNYIDGRYFFEEALNEMNQGYVDDIESESDKKYANRLIAELVENGLLDEEDAESENAEELAEDLKYDYMLLLTEQQLEEGNDGLDYFINNFGEQETYKMVMDNNLIDIDEASKDAVNVDGIGHFLSSYDGETLYLSNDCVAYRTN